MPLDALELGRSLVCQNLDPDIQGGVDLKYLPSPATPASAHRWPIPAGPISLLLLLVLLALLFSRLYAHDIHEAFQKLWVLIVDST